MDSSPSESTPKPKSSRILREAREDEASVIRDFQVAMAMESEKMKLDPVVCLRGVTRVFRDPSLGYYLVAETLSPDGSTEIVGCTFIQREWSDWRDRTILWIHSLYVRPEYRGRGFYRAIYAQLQERVKKDPELGGLRLYVDRGNSVAIAVYEKLGMTREHYHLYEWMK